MKETSKGHMLRLMSGHYTILKGNGIDIGAGDDPLWLPDSEYHVRRWDKEHGDAQLMKGVPDNTFDFVYSSHCLEHMVNVEEALRNWTRILKPDGFLYVIVPDYQLYEQMSWPSRYNEDHKHSFSLTLTRRQVGRENHHGPERLRMWAETLGLYKVHASLQDQGFDYNAGPGDQTRGEALAQICLIFRKFV